MSGLMQMLDLEHICLHLMATSASPLKIKNSRVHLQVDMERGFLKLIKFQSRKELRFIKD